MKDRITQFLKSEGISPAEFADKIGVQRSSVSHVLNGRNYPSASFIQKMLSAYRTLNTRWLLLGEGTIFENRNIPDTEPTLFENRVNRGGIAMLQTPPTSSILLPKDTTNQIIDEPTKDADSPFKTNTPSELNYSPPVQLTNNYLNDIKEVERIVYFFKDKTFEVYTPSK